MTTPEYRSATPNTTTRPILGEPKRAHIIRLLGQTGPATNAELAETLQLPLTTVRHHLKILRQHGLVTKTPGNNSPAMYALNTEAVRTLSEHETNNLLAETSLTESR